MHTVRSRKLLKQKGGGVSGGRDKLSLDNVPAAIAPIGWQNPAKDYEGNTWWYITRQFRSYKKFDKKKHQRALSPSCYRYILQLLSNTAKSKVWDIFFTMRSCEYTLAGSNNCNCSTITVCAYNIKLFKHDIKLIPTSHLLQLSDYISSHSDLENMTKSTK